MSCVKPWRDKSAHIIEQKATQHSWDFSFTKLSRRYVYKVVECAYDFLIVWITLTNRQIPIKSELVEGHLTSA